MGGNALKQFGIITDRKSKLEYQQIIREVKTIAMLNLNATITEVISFKNKQDFGDADLLIVSDDLPNHWVDTLKDAFESKAIYNNGDVVSFEYKNFQIDIIKCPSHEFMASYHYFSFNDLGNLLGRMTKKFGLKLGHDGLTYVYRDGDQVIGNIVITREFHEVCWFLGVDYQQWKEGFNDLDDIFKFVASSRYFNPDIYLFDNLNHTQRVRDRKRKTYNAFLEWCKSYDGPKYEHTKDQDSLLPMLFEFWGPNNGFHDDDSFREQYINLYMHHLKKKDMQSKFSGEIVRGVVGLDGKELGMLMKYLKTKIDEDFIITQSRSSIENKVRMLYNEWLNGEPK